MVLDKDSFLLGLAVGRTLWVPRPPAVPIGYLTFRSESSFALSTANGTKSWDGTLEYSLDGNTWTEWNGASISAISGRLYLRGSENTIITGSGSNYFVLTGFTGIECIGSIEILLDYQTVQSGDHPTMGTYAFYKMFYGCTLLTKAPAVHATMVSNFCYSGMFRGCTALEAAPRLPVTTLARGCYQDMFTECEFTEMPALPATELAPLCYRYMFTDCVNLETLKELPATTLEAYCYAGMFSGANLFTAPKLPATTLAPHCYEYMFNGCPLNEVPLLPATTLEESCYAGMFSASLIEANATQTSKYRYPYRVPATGTGTDATDALSYMFDFFTPTINTTFYLDTPVQS